MYMKQPGYWSNFKNTANMGPRAIKLGYSSQVGVK